MKKLIASVALGSSALTLLAVWGLGWAAIPSTVKLENKRVRVSELNHTVEASRSLQYGGVETGRIVGSGDHNDAILCSDSVEAVEQRLETYRPFLCAFTFGREGTIKVFEDDQGRGVLGGFSE